MTHLLIENAHTLAKLSNVVNDITLTYACDNCASAKYRRKHSRWHQFPVKVYIRLRQRRSGKISDWACQHVKIVKTYFLVRQSSANVLGVANNVIFAGPNMNINIFSQ